MTPTADPHLLRIGDRERSQAADRLATHAAAGRLTVEELEQRLERAQAAVYARELAALEADLPARRPRPQPPRRPPLLAAALVCLLAGVLVTILVGHPVPPLLIAAFLLWRAGRRVPPRFRAIRA